MAVDIHKLIASISPDTFCSDRYLERGESDNSKDKTVRDMVKRIVKETGDYLKAAEKAEMKESDYVDVAEIKDKENAFNLAGIRNPIEKHKTIYDMSSQSLEPLYFWIIDYVNGFEYGDSEKLVDNFISSASSGHFAEMQGRATRMQEEAMKIMQTAGVLIKSILNIIYDLKEFQLRLENYDDLKSPDKNKRESALLTLKQIWMDNVDIKRANTSIKAMAQQYEYVTIIDAFMTVKSLDHVDELDLNEKVKRIIKQRMGEFEKWLKRSEVELRKRFKIEKIYLKSQVDSIKLYSKWVKPYFKAAQQLEQRASPTSALVNTFNTALFELTIMGKGKYDPAGDIAIGELPKHYKKLKLRRYTPIVIVELRFRSVPDRLDQRGGYGFRGKAEIEFTSYALNDDELKVLREQLEKDDIGDTMKLIEGATSESLEEIQKDIDEFLKEEEPKEEKEEKPEDTNPFSALLSPIKSLFYLKKRKEEKDLSKGIPKDAEQDRVIRSLAILSARFNCRKFYNKFKSSLGMPVTSPKM